MQIADSGPTRRSAVGPGVRAASHASRCVALLESSDCWQSHDCPVVSAISTRKSRNSPRGSSYHFDFISYRLIGENECRVPVSAPSSLNCAGAGWPMHTQARAYPGKRQKKKPLPIPKQMYAKKTRRNEWNSHSNLSFLPCEMVSSVMPLLGILLDVVHIKKASCRKMQSRLHVTH